MQDVEDLCAYAVPIRDRVYSIEVPPGQQLVVDVMLTGADDEALIVLYPSLDTCVNGRMCSNATFVASPNGQQAVWPNTMSAPVTMLVVIETEVASFGVSAVIRDAPADDTCAGPTELPTNTTLPGTTLGYLNDFETTSLTCFAKPSGPDRVYSLTVPPGERATVSLTPSDGGTADLGLHLVEGTAAACAATAPVCEASSDVNKGPHGGKAESVRLFNAGTNPMPLFAIVDSTQGGGNFNIQYTSAVPAADDVCATVTSELADAGLSTQSLTAFENDYTVGIDCAGSGGADRVYKVTVAPGQMLDAVLTPDVRLDAGLDLAVNLVEDLAECDSSRRRCVVGTDFGGRNVAESFAYVNETNAPQTMAMVVSHYYPEAAPTTFSATAVFSQPEAGEVCRTAIAKEPGVYVGESTTAMKRNYELRSSSCAVFIGNDIVYAVEVPATKMLEVTVTPTGSMAADAVPTINLIDGSSAANCQRATCLSSGSLGPHATKVSAGWSNTGMATRRVFVVVANQNASLNRPGMTFDLNIAIP